MRAGGALLCAALAAEARVLCPGERCFNSAQCDRFSACYAHHDGDAYGSCMRRYQPTLSLRGEGQVCSQPGDCDACDACDAATSRCLPLRDLTAQAHHKEVAGKPAAMSDADWERAVGKGAAEQQKLDLAAQQRLQDNVKSLQSELRQVEYEAGTTTKSQDGVPALQARRAFLSFLGSASTLMLCLAAALAVVRQRFRPPPPEAEYQEPEPEPEFVDDDSDAEVEEGTEAELLAEHRREEADAEGEGGEEAGAAAAAEELDLDPEDSNTCKICFSAVVNCVLLDCGHVCVCSGCAKRLRNCPLCRNRIRKRKKIYKA